MLTYKRFSWKINTVLKALSTLLSTVQFVVFLLYWVSVLCFCSWCECGAATASAAFCHPHGPACGSPVHPGADGLGPARAAAAAGASGPQAETADSEAAPDRRVSAAARAALAPAWSAAAGACQGEASAADSGWAVQSAAGMSCFYRPT